MEQMAKRFSDYYDNQDAAAVASMFTKDGVRVSSGVDAVSTGPEAIKDIVTTQFKSGLAHIDLVVDQVSVVGTDVAIAVGKYRSTGQGQSGPLSVNGNWTEVNVREEGVWKIRLLTLAPKPAPNAIPSGQQANAGSAGPEPNSEGAGTFGSEVKKSSVVINVDKSEQRMTVLLDGKKTYEWPVSTGRAGYSTPSGTYTATSMNEMWYSKEYDSAPMPHSIFFMKDGHAIHGSNDVKELGSAVSHGCVRISPANATKLYALVKENGLDNTEVVLSGVTPGGEYKGGTASAAHHAQAAPNRQDVQASNRRVVQAVPNRQDVQASNRRVVQAVPNRREQGYDVQPQTRSLFVDRSSGARYYVAPQGYYAGSWPYARW
jgi:uncharacterized protein (TIGR02246 family)